MSEFPRLDAVNTNLGLLSDAEIYQIYLKALGYPKSPLSGRAKEVYDNSRTKRLLTFADAIVYLMIASSLMLTDFSLFFGIPMAIAGVVSVLNIITGPLAYCGYLYYQRMDSQKIEPPAMASVNLQSPEVLSYVAQYLTSPLLDHSRIILRQFHGERESIERLIGQTREITTSLENELRTLSDPALAASYKRRLQEAQQTTEALEKKRDDLWERIHKIENETSPIERQVQELQTLAQASQRLKTIRGMTGDPLGSHSDEEAAVDSFSGLRTRVEMARQNLEGIGAGVQAYEQAVAEVKKLTT